MTTIVFATAMHTPLPLWVKNGTHRWLVHFRFRQLRTYRRFRDAEPLCARLPPHLGRFARDATAPLAGDLGRAMLR